MINVLIIITTEFVSYGGITTVMMNYHKHINSEKFKVDFASTNDNIETSLMEKLRSKGSNYYCLGNRKKNPISYSVKLYELMLSKKYDVVHVNGNSATAGIELLLASFCGVRNRIVHNHNSKCEHLFLHKALLPVFKHQYTTAVACSKKAGDWLFEDGHYFLLNNGIESECYKFSMENRQTLRGKYGIADDCTVIGNVGKFSKQKNYPFLINVFSEIRKNMSNVKLLLVGSGELENDIKKLVKNLQLDGDVIFSGMQENVGPYLSAMDVFIFPSLFEGLPLSVIEAQASGLECLVSDTIDTDVCVTDTIRQLPIDDIRIWVNEFYSIKTKDRMTISDNNIKQIKENRYDSYFAVNELEKLYLK